MVGPSYFILRSVLLLVVVSLCGDHVHCRIAPTGFPTQVTFDERAFKINGTRHLLVSGSVHYPRSAPSEWESILQKTKAASIDVVQTYVFWDVHQPNGPDDWNFEGGANIWQFLDTCAAQGLYVNLRVGPYVCAEWNLGGIPFWVKEIQGIVFRDYDTAWLGAMEAFVKRFLTEALERKIFAHQGGPVILAQIENEYGNVESSFKDPSAYVKWCVQLAQNITNKEPWIMCQQDDAPDVPNLVNSCNGFYCDDWLPGHFSSRNTPASWTENWPGWFQDWGSPKPHRPVEDVAFAVARWFARGGAHMNYYMWHGGTTWDRNTGGPLLVTSYDYDVALDEYGQPHEPKYSHSAKLHEILLQYESVIVSNPVDPGKELTTHIYLNIYGTLGSSQCIAFISNTNVSGDISFNWNGNSYSVPAWSVSILGGCGATVTYNTAKISPARTRGVVTPTRVGAINKWSFWSDTVGIWDPSSSIHSPSPLEQVATTHDKTDYFWYHTVLPSYTSSGMHHLKTEANDIAYFFVNGNLQSFVRSGHPADVILSVNSGTPSSLDILTQTVGLQNYGAHYEVISRGIADVTLDNINFNPPSGWTHQIGLKGESLQLWSNPKVVNWNPSISSGLNRPLTWWYATFDTPEGLRLALDITGLGKGFIYVNGNGVGRYWNITASGDCPRCSDIQGKCVIGGLYNPDRCSCDCGIPSQQYYHVPRDWLAPVGGANQLVLIEEIGAWDVSLVNVVAHL